MTSSFFKSIRWQIQSWHAVLLILVVAALLAAFYNYERRAKLNGLDEMLQQTLITALPVLSPPPGGGGRPGPGERPPQGEFPGQDRAGPPPGGPDRRGPDQALQKEDFSRRMASGPFYYATWDRDNTEISHSPNAPLPLPPPAPLAPGASAFRDRDGFREVMHDSPSGTVLIGVPTREAFNGLHALALELAALGSGVIAIGLVGGWWMAGRAIRPIDSISAAAREIAGGDLARRIDVRDTESELGHLAGVLNQTFDRLEKAFEQQTRFSADASHELRTPVSVILAQTQLALARERQPEEYRQALDICRRNAEGMRGLVNALMELSRIDSAQSQLSLARHDLASLASDCVELIQPLAEELGIPISITADSTPVQADRDKISRVITNLITNALRHNRPGGEVLVTVRQEKSRAFVEVADTGPGISPEDLPHIFERFYRADKARTRGQGGSGLGLAICQAFVTAHGGRLHAESAFGHGSTFTIELPLA
jgi:two-component system OmpR family sensor kinase